jgi:malate dehydrogenase (oxaloacetate-decarboxylating)
LNGTCHPISQSNNSYIFPGLGLGVLASGARRISDGMFMAASRAPGKYPRRLHCDTEPLLPSLEEIRHVSRFIARAVALQARQEGLADELTEAALEAKIEAIFWRPEYAALS